MHSSICLQIQKLLCKLKELKREAAMWDLVTCTRIVLPIPHLLNILNSIHLPKAIF